MAGKRDRKKCERQRRSTAVQNAAATARTQARRYLDETAAQVRQAVGEALRDEDAAAAPLQAARDTLGIALRVIDKSPFRSRHACEAGCAFCCYTAVTASPPELLAIADYLRRSCSDEQLAEVRRRLDENAAKAAAMSRNDYIASLIPCALLSPENRCRVHPVRPLACAGFCSTSRRKCEAEFNREPDRAQVPTDKLAMAIGVAASDGLLSACHDAGKDGKFYELNHALRVVLDDPEIAHRWSRGEESFEHCPV